VALRSVVLVHSEFNKAMLCKVTMVFSFSAYGEHCILMLKTPVIIVLL
jgi:hypothetical protein